MANSTGCTANAIHQRHGRSTFSVPLGKNLPPVTVVGGN